MSLGEGAKRGPPPVGPPGEDRPPYDMGPPHWGPPPTGGWGPPPPGGWGPPPPDGWAPPPGGWPLPAEEWGPPPPGSWGPRGPPGGWGPRGPPGGCGPRGPPGAWGPRGPPGGWGPRGPPPPDWDPRGPAPPGWGPHPDEWMPPPEDWIHAGAHWRHQPDGWRPPPEDLGPHPGWVPGGPHEPWGPEALPPPPPVPPPVGMPPPGPAFGPVPPAPVPACVPPFVFPTFPPPAWTGEPIVEDPMPNPPPEQPEWIKALISAPPADSAPADTKKSSDELASTDPPKPQAKCKKGAKDMCLLGKRTFDKPPPGRSTGIISFVGPTFGHIEREDSEKFTFSFDAFFGNPKAMTPGVRVHFTACKEKNSQIATDVKVAPGGTENVDTEIFEAVVSKPIVEPQPGERQYPGQVYVNLGPLRTNLKFERSDSSVTLLQDDQVLLNVLSDIVTKKRRATNIRPKIPSTFNHTKEARLKGVIVSLRDSEGVLRSDQHGELPFDVKENFSDVDFCAEDAGEEVEFTLMELKAGKRAVRIQRVNEPLLLTLCAAKEAEVAGGGGEESGPESRLVPNFKEELLSNLKLDPELYEGVVSQPIIEPTPTTSGYPGQICANIGPIPTNVTFDHRDCSFTLLKNDHVLINLLVDTVTNKRRAANIRPKIPFTFTYTKEIRAMGVITHVGADEGLLKSDEHGELPFNLCENFSDSEFTAGDVHVDVEFTASMVEAKKRAIRLRRMKKMEEQSLPGQKKCKEEDKEDKEEEEKRRTEEQERERKKEEVTAALAAAKNKWTPLGFTVRDPGSLDDISKERFEGTVLRAISKKSRKEIKKEEEEEEEEKGAEAGGAQVETEEEVEVDAKAKAGEAPLESEPPSAAVETGRLVMTVDGHQKLLQFGAGDLLSTATMLDGDKVRFNIATNRETKAERATLVEILPDSFEESIEQRRHGIVIEFASDSGLIKCTQNPQLYFRMSEVIEKKKLELNEKVEFSVVPHETAEGGHQAIRIKRFTESVFLPARKLGGVAAGKGKMTIKLSKPSEEQPKAKPESDKLKAVVKTLRAQDSKTDRRDYSATRHRHGRSRTRSRSRSRSRSPSRDQFGRIVKERRSPSVERKSSRYRRSRERSRRRSRSRSRSRSKSSSRSSSPSRSRSQSQSKERSKDKAKKRRSKSSRESEDSRKRRREPSPPQRRGGVVDDELARKKRELEELNEMIAYKKSLVDADPGQRTCIDYDHGRIAVPLAEYKPVRSILKKRADGPEYLRHPPYDDPYYGRSYGPYEERRYSDPYGSYPERPYGDPPYGDRRYEARSYGRLPFSPPGQRFADRYDVYEEPFEDRSCSSSYPERSLDPFERPKPGDSSEPRGSTPPARADPPPAAAASSSSLLQFRPPSPGEPPPRSPSPKAKFTASGPPPPAVKPPLDRFLDMLNKTSLAQRKAGQSNVSDDLLPHERALQDGKGFSQIVGLAQESPRPPVEVAKWSSGERAAGEAEAEQYDKIQSLLRTIGLKLSPGEVSRLASRAQEKLHGLKASSTERSASSFPEDNPRLCRSGSVESELVRSPSSARSSSLEPLSKRQSGAGDYEGLLDQQELEALKRAQQLHSLTKSMSSPPAPQPPLAPPSAHSQHPPALVDWALGVASLAETTATSVTGAPAQSQPRRQPPGPPPGPPPRRPGQPPPGPPAGLPPRHPLGQPPFPSLSSHAAPSAPSGPCDPPKTLPAAVTSGASADGRSAISTTVARCLKVIETVKSLTALPSAKAVKSVQFSLPAEASLSSGPASSRVEDEVLATQKDKLDLYHQRILEKREQQFSELLARRKLADKNQEGSPSPPGKLPSGAKNVWICGHSLVHWAESRAKAPEVGMPLGMDPDRVAIWWNATQGMTWPQLLPQLQQLKVSWPKPDILIVHLGGNDLSTDGPTDLLVSVRKDLTSVRSIFPQCVLVWSNILPRRVWRHSADSHEMDLVRTTVNRRIQNIVSELGGTSLTHDNIRCGANTGLYRADGVHLSAKGLDVFNLNLQDFLDKWLLESCGGPKDS